MPEPEPDAGVSYEKYVDGQLAEVRRSAELALTSRGHEGVALKEFFEAILDEQRRGMVVAEQEREKAAAALRSDLARAIDEGDDNLRSHIDGQVHQIREAMESAEKLELSRYERLGAQIEAVQREVTQAADASEKAIAKAESATERRFEAVNEFRSQLSDQVARFMPREVADGQFAEVQAKFDQATRHRGELLPREVFDRTLGEWTAWRQDTDKRLNNTQGKDEANTRQEDKLRPWQLWAAGALVTFANAAFVVGVNVIIKLLG